MGQPILIDYIHYSKRNLVVTNTAVVSIAALKLLSTSSQRVTSYKNYSKEILMLSGLANSSSLRLF